MNFGNKFYSLNAILEKKAQYNMIIGERSNGKTYAALLYGLKKYCESGEQLAIVRRWQEDFVGRRGATMFAAIVSNGEVEKITKGLWTDIYYYSSRWYLCSYDEKGKRIQDETPFAYGFAISSGEHDKSSSYPGITTIVFDEFLTRSFYLPDEFIQFTNTISTIIRQRTNVTIFMLGNTVNKSCPYFNEMGLTHIKKMEQGTIDVYTFGESELKVAVEYCKPNKRGKSNNFYFAFDNPKLQMITSGAWEISVYPHLPYKYKPKDVAVHYYINFEGEWLHCEVVFVDNVTFTFVHMKTTPLSDHDANNVLIYSQQFDARPNWKRKITKATSLYEKRILSYYSSDKIFFSTNEVGEIMRNYLMWCTKGS